MDLWAACTNLLYLDLLKPQLSIKKLAKLYSHRAYLLLLGENRLVPYFWISLVLEGNLVILHNRKENRCSGTSARRLMKVSRFSVMLWSTVVSISKLSVTLLSWGSTRLLTSGRVSAWKVIWYFNLWCSGDSSLLVFLAES